MFDNLAAYFHEYVVQSFDDCLREKASGVKGRSQDLRAAVTAASALFHFREHLPVSCELSRRKAEKLCPDYRILADISNTSKHRELTKDTPSGKPLLKSAADLQELIVLTEYCDIAGPYRHAKKRVIAKLTDGTTRNVLEVLTNVMNFWLTYLYQNGVISKARPYAQNSDDGPVLRADANNGYIDYVATQGLRFSETMQLRKYNYATGKPEPVDLTGARAQYTIRKPPQYSVEISLRHDSTGTEAKRSVQLSEDESMTLDRLQTDNERGDYVSGLPKTQAAYREMAEELQLPKLAPPTAEQGS